MLPKPGVTQNLARFVAETKWEDVPDQVRHEAKRALLNFFAVAIGAGILGEQTLKLQVEIAGGHEPSTAMHGHSVIDHDILSLFTFVHPALGSQKEAKTTSPWAG